MTTKLISLDLGTTHTKAGLFAEDGRLHKTASRKTVAHQDPSHSTYFDPGELWAAVVEIIREITEGTHPGEIAAIGITRNAAATPTFDHTMMRSTRNAVPSGDAKSGMETSCKSRRTWGACSCRVSRRHAGNAKLLQRFFLVLSGGCHGIVSPTPRPTRSHGTNLYPTPCTVSR